jgi:hypothetical protein
VELLQHLPNGGAVVAVVVVVMIFLKRQDTYDDRMQAIASRFADEIQASRKDYLEHLRELTGRDPRPRPRP